MRWQEWEGAGLGDNGDHIMYVPQFTDQLDDLLPAVMLTGWVDRREAHELMYIRNLQVGWFGYLPGDYEPHACTEDGETLDSPDEYVEIVMPMTWILVK